MTARFLFSILLVCSTLIVRAQTTDEKDLTVLDPLTVASDAGDGFDLTGMGGPDASMKEPPFSNDLLAGNQRDDDFASELATELSLAAGVSPVDLATAVNRVNLRGFPTPRLRNGFSQTGIPEILAVERVELIQGPLTPVAGRAAPGGIQNFVTARPRDKRYTRLEFSADTQDSQQVRAETSAALVAKKIWHRLAIGGQHRDGPEIFSHQKSRYLSGALTFRHSRSASTMVMFDYSELSANPAPGIPEYRNTSSGKILGPWRPLAEFHTYGPNADIEKKLTSASVQFEGQLGRRVSIRANLQGWMRELVEDRFTTSQYIVDLGRFGGTREPQRTEQPLSAISAGIETTARLLAFKADHKITLLIESNQLRNDREQRALPSAIRNALPQEVREFDPDSPDYYRPVYSEELYSRILTDRHEATSFSSVMLTERAAVHEGRIVATTGIRADFVSLKVTDHRPGVSRPHITDRVRELTYHAGGNYQFIPNRLLVFANTSSAFEPSTRIDARTGRIQGNETTLGFETGLKGFFFRRRLNATALLFRYYNQNISRRNPLYEDPIADAAQTQPQLVAAGEERFTGGTLDLKTTLATLWTVSGRATITQALTTASPDLPEEIGSPLSRLPRTTLGLSLRRGFTGRLSGFSINSTLTYVSGFVANYESSSRRYLAYPSNTLVNLGAGYTWKNGPKKTPRSHNLGLGVRNVFDHDLLASHARVGQERALNTNYTLSF